MRKVPIRPRTATVSSLIFIFSMLLVFLVPNNSSAINCTLAQYAKFCAQPTGGGSGVGFAVGGGGGVGGASGAGTSTTTAVSNHDEQIRLYLMRWVSNPVEGPYHFVSYQPDKTSPTNDYYFHNAIKLMIDDQAIIIHHHDHLKESPYVPQWIQKLTLFWLNNDISNPEFFSTLQYLVDNRIVKV